MIVAGIGCRRNATAEAIEASIEAALAVCQLGRSEIAALATAVDKGGEPGLLAAAGRLALKVVLVEEADMALVAGRAFTLSQRVLELKGVPSVAETAALAAAGPGSRLLAPRVSNREASCAIAIGEDE